MSVNVLRAFFGAMCMLALASGAAVYWLWTQSIPAPSERQMTVWVPPKRSVSAAVAEMSDAANYVESFARPIFSPTRRPFVPQAEEPVPAPENEVVLMPVPETTAPDGSQIVLKGVRVNLGERQALILSPASPTARWFTLGSQVEGFQLVEIGDDQILLESGQQKLQITLYGSKAAN